jgi:peptidoglycan hydrolase CwlO-like protein
VGSNATLRAISVKIGGQTHKTSTISAETAEVTVHRGTIEANEVTVERLEGGKIIADVARIGSVVGGDVTARLVYIDKLFSNSYIATSELIEIKELKGNNNKFLVDVSSSKAFKSQTTSLTERIETTQKTLEKLPKQLEQKKGLIDKNKQSVEMIKAKIEELKAEGKKPPVTFMGKLKEYQQLVNEYNAMLKNMKDVKFQLNDLKEELGQLQSKIFSAKVINHSPWKEYNEIKFKLISPPIEIIHNTRNHEMSKMINLTQATDDTFKINRSSQITS